MLFDSCRIPATVAFGKSYGPEPDGTWEADDNESDDSESEVDLLMQAVETADAADAGMQQSTQQRQQWGMALRSRLLDRMM